MKEKISKNTLKELEKIAMNASYALGQRGGLETKNNDAEDFQELSVWSIKEMLEKAYHKKRLAKTEDLNLMIEKAIKTYNIPEITTTEKLECDEFDKLLIYGDKVLAPGKAWIKNKEGNYVVAYFGTTYEFTTNNHTCEGEIKLKAVSDAIFKDNGHAIAWAMQQ